MLLPRLITAVVGIPLILLSIYYGGIPFFILIVTITVFALSEYFYILEQAQYGSHKIAGYIFAIITFLGIFFNGTKILTPFENQTVSIVLTLGLMTLFFVEIFRSTIYNKNPEGSTGRVAVTFLGVFLLSWSFGHLILLRDIHPHGDKYVFYLFIMIWLVDTGAYAVGVNLGRRRLSEQISPKKTVEGALGGIITAMAVSIALWYVSGLREFSLQEATLLGVLISVVSYISDLSESLLKRDAGLKDS
ncbi:MAG: phosphatidate cytidylyltransferase, partial [Elusimicrobiota bacterium]